MKRIDFRTLKKEEILLRPQSVKNGKVTLLCYQDARCAMDILDDTLGAFGWQKKYEEIKGNVYCSIGIKNEENGEWVWKSDCGAESNIEREKGEASDATKRAAVCWGIGRELYSAPRIIIDDDGYGNTGYKVLEIDYDGNRNIKHLVIGNKFDKEVWRWDSDKPTQTQAVGYTLKVKPVEEPRAYDDQEVEDMKSNREVFTEYCTFLKKEKDTNIEELKKFYSFYAEKESKKMGGIPVDVWERRIEPAKLWGSWLSRLNAA